MCFIVPKVTFKAWSRRNALTALGKTWHKKDLHEEIVRMHAAQVGYELDQGGRLSLFKELIDMEECVFMGVEKLTQSELEIRDYH